MSKTRSWLPATFSNRITGWPADHVARCMRQGALAALLVAGVLLPAAAQSCGPWINGNSPSALDWLDIAYGNGTFVAVSGFTVATSPDADHWNAWSTVDQGVFARCIVWGGTQFVTLGTTGSATSPDGIHWTGHSMTGGITGNIYKVAWNGSLLVGVGENGLIITGTDGANWVKRISGTTTTLTGVAWTGAKFAAVGGSAATGANVLCMSADGIAWTVQAFPQGFVPSSIAAGPGGLVAAGIYASSGSAAILASPDGTTWTQVTNPSTSPQGNLLGVNYGGSRFVAVGTNALIFTSPDGAAWNHEIPPTTQSLKSASFGALQSVVVGATGTIFRSTCQPVCELACTASAPGAGSANTPIQFAATVTPSNCTGTPAFAWSFGDGQSSAAQNPVHTYTTGGNFSWSMTTSLGTAKCQKYGSIAITAPVPPPVITLIKKTAPPFALTVTGSNLQSGIRVTINGAEWSSVQVSSSTKLKITGGKSLKAKVPKGTPISFSFTNPDGGSASVTGWSW